MNRHASFFCAATIAALITSQLQAQTPIFWQGGAGTLIDANYSDGTNANLSPGATDYVHIGLDGAVTLSGGAGAGFGRLRVGHNVNPTVGTFEGAGTLTLTGSGTFVELTDGLAAPNAAVWVGNGHNGELNIEDGAMLQANRLVVIGAGSNGTPTGTLNVTTGGWLRVLDGNLSIADRSGMTGNGVKGVVNLSGSTSQITIEGPATDLIVGARSRTGIFNQTDGTVTVVDSVEVANANSSSTGSTLSISGGSLTTGTTGTGNFFVGRGSSVGATVNIAGTAVVNVGNRYLMGGSDTPMAPAVPTAIATGAVTNHSGGTLNTDSDVRIADTFVAATSEATYNLSGTGIINTNVAGIPADPLTTSNVIGRRGIGRFIQTGGTANFNSPLEIGNRQSTGTAIAANGLYKISAGNLNVNAPTTTWPLGLNIAPNGTGEFRVVGDDATIDVTGDFAISSTADGNGTLAFELETGELFSLIDVSGIATFDAGAILALDASIATPAQPSYDVLTAVSIVDNGIDFNGPAGWGFEIVSGGNGQILRLVEGIAPVLTGDYNEDGVVDAADYVVWRKNPGAFGGDQGYTDWRANFGATSPGSGSDSGAVSQVPEPAAVALLLLGMVSFAFGRRPVRAAC